MQAHDWKYLCKFCATILWLLYPSTSNHPPSKYCLPSCPADPSPPRNVTITRVFREGVELNWLPSTEPNGEVHYVIEYKREDSGSWTSVNTTSDSTHYNLTGLHSGTNYTIRVVAVNSAGLHKSTPITVEMTSATPTSNSTATPTYSSTDTPTSNNTVVPTPIGTNEEDKKGRWWRMKLICII